MAELYLPGGNRQHRRLNGYRHPTPDQRAANALQAMADQVAADLQRITAELRDQRDLVQAALVDLSAEGVSLWWQERLLRHPDGSVELRYVCGCDLPPDHPAMADG